MPFNTGHTEDDVEMGEHIDRDEVGEPEPISLESLARNEFRKSLQSVFSKDECVHEIMMAISYWEDEM